MLIDPDLCQDLIDKSLVDQSLVKNAIWVDDNQKFKKLARSWLSCEYLAIDTEFERRTTYYPILALVQVFDGDKIYLIDPLKVECPQEFKDICANQNIIKIMHSAREDLEVFFYSWGCQFKGLFDTQVAYAFLTGEMSKGYAGLVEILCHTRLDKEQTQSDWMKRPLSSKQLDYAARDVIFLPDIYLQLTELFKQKNTTHLFNLECEELSSLVTRQPDYDLDYREAKDVWRLNAKQLALFKILYQWREQTAIKTDRTKNHILKDPDLVQVAIIQPLTKATFQKINNFHPRSFRLYWQELLQLVEDFKDNPSELPIIPNPRDVNGFIQLSEKLLSKVKEESRRLDVETGLLASKRLVNKIAFAILVGEALPETLNGWRGEILKPLLAPIISQFISSDNP